MLTIYRHKGNENHNHTKIDDHQREEVEIMIPKVNSWRDTGDTPGRKNHQKR
jgi:hypothetical protein